MHCLRTFLHIIDLPQHQTLLMIQRREASSSLRQNINFLQELKTNIYSVQKALFFMLGCISISDKQNSVKQYMLNFSQNKPLGTWSTFILYSDNYRDRGILTWLVPILQQAMPHKCIKSRFIYKKQPSYTSISYEKHFLEKASYL